MSNLLERLQPYRDYTRINTQPVVQGRITRMIGLRLEAVGLNVSIGHTCQVVRSDGQAIETEVVGFSGNTTFLMPIQSVDGLQPGAPVLPRDSRMGVSIGMQSLGRVIDGLGKPLDTLGVLKGDDVLPLRPSVINPLHRRPVDEPLDVGIRAINGLLTVGKGQRMGLFAGSGVGKSILMGMMTKFTKADIVVVGLIGERGREVKEFIDNILGKQGLARAVVVASPADDAPLMRLKASYLATSIAEYFRDQGKSVLLLMDSLTRFAQAQREIALAIGEPPATKGYPPSVFARIPELVERAGNGDVGSGSVTAFYTVLTEGDDLQDPIADAARAILDGHIVLSRRLAEEGIYPAIDVEASISRVMQQVIGNEQLKNAHHFKRLLATYNENKDLIMMGAYKAGSKPELDEAIARRKDQLNYISQSMTQKLNSSESVSHLNHLLSQSLVSNHGHSSEATISAHNR